MSKYLSGWLSGTTCNRDKRKCVLLENATHIVMKHNSHSEYVDRMSGTVTCESYARLYAKADIKNLQAWGSLAHTTPYIHEWTGRITESRVRKDCADLGVDFDK